MRIGLLAAVVVLSGCTKAAVSTETRVQVVKELVPAPCPDKDVYDRLKRKRPVPLRHQPMPDTPDARVAQQQAQLGRFEAEGGWADKVEAALDRCQLEEGK